MDFSCWTLGLRNNAGMYLTAETFANKLACNGKSLRHKQVFTLEQRSGSESVSFKSHLGRYLTADKDGKLTCEAESVGNDQQFFVEAMHDGRWVIRTSHGRYIGGTGDHLDAFGQDKTAADRIWTVQLAMHPQICLYNLNRKKYVHLRDDRLRTDEVVPFNADATITIVFFNEGRYGLRDCRGRFLTSNGDLVDTADASCQFVLEFYGGAIALRNSDDQYLTSSLGTDGALKACKDGPPTKDELYEIHDSKPQFALQSHVGKWVSVRTIVAADFDKVTDSELLEFEGQPDGSWAIHVFGDEYLSINQAEGRVFKRKNIDESCIFNIEWHNDKIALRSRSRGNKYICRLPNGVLNAAKDSLEDDCLFAFELRNRQTIALRGIYGFFGTMKSSKTVECNKSAVELYNLHMERGVVRFSTLGGGNWQVSDDLFNITTGGNASEFFLEFIDSATLVIKYVSGGESYYVTGQQNGRISVDVTDRTQAAIFEY